MVDYFKLAGKREPHIFIALLLVFPLGVFTWALVLGRLVHMRDSFEFFCFAFLLAIASAIAYGVLMTKWVKGQREKASFSLMEHIHGLMK